MNTRQLRSTLILAASLFVAMAIGGCRKEGQQATESAQKEKKTGQVHKKTQKLAREAENAPAEKQAEKIAEAPTPDKGSQDDGAAAASDLEKPEAAEEAELAPVKMKMEVKAEEKAEPKVAEKRSEMSVAERKSRAKKLLSNRTVVGMVGSDFGGAEGGGMANSFARIAPSQLGQAGLGSVGIKGPSRKLLPSPSAEPDPSKPRVQKEMDKEVPGTENYARIIENPFQKALDNPLSTFSIDVDTASYTNMRRFINTMNRLPPPDAVRIEEFINYFTYDYKEPGDEVPFSVNTEITTCPWNKKHRLALIGLQGQRLKTEEIPPSNLVFLLDVSGSMNSPGKLGLLKQGFKLLVRQLSKKDRVAIVVYAGAAGLVLPSTPGDKAQQIMSALNNLRAGGSTAGGAGIKLAYEIAQKHFIKEGNNRVILATDGDFNVGASSQAELERMIEEKRENGVFLTVLGFGRGNYKDSRMEALADKGNGNYAYIDNLLEAKKVLVTQLTATLFTIAKDVKLQIEFNPTRVKEYRLIGYENRVLAKEDFDDDTKDAGELGAGHTVTALYEIVPETGKPGAGEDLKYVKTKVKDTASSSGELMTVKLRYKKPTGNKSTKIEEPVLDEGSAFSETTRNLRFAAAAASFGMLLRHSKHKGTLTYKDVIEMARRAKGKDRFGYRAEFIQLVEKADLLQPSSASR